MSKKINLALIFGGQSGEHEVSLSSAIGIMQALDKNEYNIIPIAITKKGNWLAGERGQEYIDRFKHLAGRENAISVEDSQSLVTREKNLSNFIEGNLGIEKIDLVFPILHGPYGEDGRIQGMLDCLGVPYVFSDTLAHALAMNKPKAKIITKNIGVPVAQDIILNKTNNYNIEEIIAKLSLPLIVKPAELGSSVGITKAENKEELENSIRQAFTHCNEIIIEQFIKGRELTVTILEDPNPRVLAITEIIPLISDFYDYKAKYADGGSKHVCPAKLPKEVEKNIKKEALKVFQAIGCKDLSRVDFIWDEKNNKYYFIEINTIPGMTKTSLAPEAAQVAGISFTEMLDKIINPHIKKDLTK